MARKVISSVDAIETTVVTSPKLYTVTIMGADGCLMNRMEDLSVPKSKKKDQAKTDKTELEYLHWREKMYVNGAGHVCWPSENIHECMKSGTIYWGAKIPGAGNKKYADLVARAIVPEEMEISVPGEYDFLTPDNERYITPFGKEVNGNPSNFKGSSKVFKIRPLIRPWGGSFLLHVFDARLSVEILRNILSMSAMFVGLSDWRPKFGRFELVSIEENGFEKVA